MASRRFSRLLDDVESGRRFAIHRHGKVICVMTPPPVRGRRASECLASLRSKSSTLLDEEFGKDLLDLVEGEEIEERPPWGS